jgi:hypothetical protein
MKFSLEPCTTSTRTVRTRARKRVLWVGTGTVCTGSQYVSIFGTVYVLHRQHYLCPSAKEAVPGIALLLQLSSLIWVGPQRITEEGWGCMLQKHIWPCCDPRIIVLLETHNQRQREWSRSKPQRLSTKVCFQLTPIGHIRSSCSHRFFLWKSPSTDNRLHFLGYNCWWVFPCQSGE